MQNNNDYHNKSKNIYAELKAIYEGCDNIMDALPFYNEYIEKYPEYKGLIYSYTYGKIFMDNVDIKTKQAWIDDIYMCDSKTTAFDLISKISDKSNDDIYKKTLQRIANNKNYKKVENTKKIDPIKTLAKSCPHCAHTISMPEKTNYIICGYQNSILGYDWSGCGRDWCFSCGKMLCKKWESDKLHLQMNRTHDDECCSKHAKDNGYVYPDDYCKCNNSHVHRSFDIF